MHHMLCENPNSGDSGEPRAKITQMRIHISTQPRPHSSMRDISYYHYFETFITHLCVFYC